MKYIIKSPCAEIMPLGFDVKLNRTVQKKANWKELHVSMPFVPYTQSVQSFKLHKATVNVQGNNVAIKNKGNTQYFSNIPARDLSIIRKKLKKGLYRNLGKLFKDLTHGAKPIKRVEHKSEVIA